MEINKFKYMKVLKIQNKLFYEKLNELLLYSYSGVTLLSLLLFILIQIQNTDINAEPKLNDELLTVNLLVEGLKSPTSMAFLDKDHILVLEKNSGKVLLVTNNKLQNDPVLKLNIDNTTPPTCCRGLLGIAVENDKNSMINKNIFIYFSERLENDTVKNRLYKYQYNNFSLTKPILLLDLPATATRPNHPGGKIAVANDHSIYTVIGDLNNNGMLQNNIEDPQITDSSVIFHVNSSDGQYVKSNPFVSYNSSKLSKYYGYGIRNSFGLNIDPVTGYLWDTENGVKDYDEINLVLPGFNSGWKKLMGPISNSKIDKNDLVTLEGARYIDPVFSFSPSLGITDIEFFNSTLLGTRYFNNIFVGDISNGNLYFFKVNSTRTGLEFDIKNQKELLDLVSNGKEELSKIIFGSGFKGITDIETGPDGLLYVLTFDRKSKGDGKIYQIILKEGTSSIN